MDKIIELEHVSFSYETEPNGAFALADIDLSIEEGALVGVIGPSGAGKSTLASLISGAIPHHYTGRLFGSTKVAGVDTCDASLTDIARLVGSVLQDIDAQMVASVVEDELLFGLENFGVPRERIEGRLTAALDAVGIADLREREIATLSGGQKQKVAIAAILALAPRVIVMDEPTAALDPVSAREVLKVLKRARELGGMTIVIIEQMVALLAEFCERVIVLDEGRVALDGTPREVFSHADELRRIGVDSPRASRIANCLAAAGLTRGASSALTAREAEALITDILDGPVDGPVARRALDEPHRAGAPARRGIPDDAPAVVEVERASFSYGEGAASVTDLDLIVRRGEIRAIAGQNGAGKTTFTKLLNGLLKPESGRIRIAGLDTLDTPVSALAAHVATLFQNPDHQLCRDTVLEEVAFGLQLQGIPAATALERAGAVSARFGLDPGAAPFSLSRGQRQMVALASVAILDPDLIILDEPTSGLDYRECMTVMGTVRERARAGAAVIMVCHDMEVVSDFADTLTVMAGGRILATGPTHEVFAREGLLAAARISAPDVPALAGRLAASHPAFAGVTEVSELVETVKELKSRA